nr:hypothetical protein [uncultured Schaedlerella sp.]
MLRGDREEQWAEALALWVDRKVMAYLKENHSEFEAILKKQEKLAEQYPVIVRFLNEDGAMEMTAEEHHAVMEYLNLRERSEFLLREYRYYLGQAMHIPGLREFGIHKDGEPETEEDRINQLFDLMAENQVEEADQMLRSENPEYQSRVKMESEAQKMFSEVTKTKELKDAVDSYVDAVNGRWLMFSKLLYQYSVEKMLRSLEEPEEQQDL